MYPKIDAAISFEEAWPILANSEPTLALYQRQAAVFGWPPFAPSPFVAYWAARNIVSGKWAGAEPYIKSDPQVWKDYTTFVHIWIQLGGNIPLVAAKPVLPPKTIDDNLVDEVITRVELFRNSRHRRRLLNEGEGTLDESETTEDGEVG